MANDSHPNFLYENQKDGTFKEVGFPMGVAVSEDGGEQGSMGVAVGDYDNSGRLSIYVTNFSEEYGALYRNEGDHFTDVSFRSKTAAASLPFVKWGTSFFDYDNDGLLDLIVVNGHVYPQVDQVPMGASAGYRQRKLLYHNRRGGEVRGGGRAVRGGDDRPARRAGASPWAISTTTGGSTSWSTTSTAPRRSCTTSSPTSATG